MEEKDGGRADLSPSVSLRNTFKIMRVLNRHSAFEFFSHLNCERYLHQSKKHKYELCIYLDQGNKCKKVKLNYF